MSEEFSFEKAYSRLEEILAKMNSGQISLEESLELYEEADSLIGKCSIKLDKAEKKIQMLMKNRDKSLQKSEEGTPSLGDCLDDNDQILIRENES